jgi:hypothetical protein
VDRSARETGSTADIASGGQARFPGSTTSSTIRTLPSPHGSAPELASRLDGSSAGELIPELARNGLQQLIELEASAAVAADRHERSQVRVNEEI